MVDVDLDYCKVVGRLGIVVGDSSNDVDADPDTVWCDSGFVNFTPLTKELKVLGGPSSPFTAGSSTIKAYVGPDGRLMYNGLPFVMLLDLGSEKLNPYIPLSKATYSVTFESVMAGDIPVSFSNFSFHPIAGQDNDITLMSPVRTGASVSVTMGPRGYSISGATVNGGNLILTLSDGTSLAPLALPPGPKGDPGAPGPGSYSVDPAEPDVLIINPGDNEYVDPTDSQILVVVT